MITYNTDRSYRTRIQCLWKADEFTAFQPKRHKMEVKNNKSSQWIEQIHCNFPELRALGKKRTVRVVTCSHMTASWSVLPSGGVTQFTPLVTQFVVLGNYWSREARETWGFTCPMRVTTSPRRTPSSSSQKCGVFIAFQKVSHPCKRHCFNKDGWTSVYLRQMDRASGPLHLARHLFHLARKTSTV